MRPRQNPGSCPRWRARAPASVCGSRGLVSGCALPHLQLLFAIEAADLFLVHSPPLTFQHHMYKPVAKPAALSRHGLHCIAQINIVRTHAATLHARSVNSKDRTRPPLPHPMLCARMRHSFPLRSGRYHIREATSFSMAVSNICLASSFFSLAFSAPSAFRLRSSDALKSQNFAYHMWNVDELTQCSRQTSAFDTTLFKFFRVAMICSSLNRGLFILSVSFVEADSISSLKRNRGSGHDIHGPCRKPLPNHKNFCSIRFTFL